MTEQYPTAICVALNYLEDRGWSELIDPRWAPELLEEFRHSGLGWTDQEIIDVVSEVLNGEAEWNSKDRLSHREETWPTRQEQIDTSIKYNGFSEHTLQLIDNYVNDILYGRANIHRFNLQEHAGLCTAGATLIGAYSVCCYARASFEPSRFSAQCQERIPGNWEIDAKQEEVLQKWAEAKMLWIPESEKWITSTFGPKIAQQAEGVNYIGERLYLEDMHPANVFIDELTGKPICIDCIVKFH